MVAPTVSVQYSSGCTEQELKDSERDRTDTVAGGSSKYCPFFHHTIELLGRRWTGVILRELMAGPQRFCEVRSSIPGLSDRLLAERLDELEREGLVSREAKRDHLAYALTDRGQSLGPVIEAISYYAARWSNECAPAERPGRIR